MINDKRFRFRIIVPLFPNFNIYTSIANTTTSSGPIYVATSANKLDSWDVEVIDENNCHGKFFPRDKDNRLDHAALQKERPADVVGFYGSISSTIPRLYQLAGQYKNMGAKTVAGGKHVESLPLEALSNDVDVVVFHEGEMIIKDLLTAWEKNWELKHIAGIAYMESGRMITNKERPLIEEFDRLPLPDFSLLKYAKMKLYPVNRSRGCNSRCEFCTVRDRARCIPPGFMMAEIKNLVENYNARNFFETSDHFASRREEAIQFCGLLAEYQEKHDIRLNFTVQTRITDARYPELLQAMRNANIETVCIGYESPIDEELLSMRKGYLSQDLLEWTNTFHKYKFFIHGMFIFGYPKSERQKNLIPLDERVKRFRKFIKEAKLDTLQILITVPLPGTELRKRLDDQNRLYPLNDIGWEYYDGQFPLFKPDDDVSPEDIQKAVAKLMKNFYPFRTFWKIAANIIFLFPGIMFTSSLTLILGKVRYIISAFRLWNKKFFRNDLMRFGGYFLLKSWFKKFKKGTFRERLIHAKTALIKNTIPHSSA